jgi:gamma-glutamyltranspeptidase
VPAPQRTARIEDKIGDPAQERAKAEGASLAALMRAAVQSYADGQLTSTDEHASQGTGKVTGQPGPASQPASQAAVAITITDSEPGPGVACAAPRCWQRNTANYGLRRLPVCPACRAALEGRTYQSEVPEPAARAVRRGAVTAR